MKLKDRLDNIFDVQKRFGYVVNKWLFRFAFILMFVVFGLIVVTEGFDVAVHGASAFVCPESEFRCVNPYVEPVCYYDGFNRVCDYQYLYGGAVYGVVPSLYARIGPFIVVGLFAFALLLNHLIYNKKFWSVKK